MVEQLQGLVREGQATWLQGMEAHEGPQSGPHTAEAKAVAEMLALPFLGVAPGKIGLNPSHQLPDVGDALAHLLGGPVHVQQHPRP